MIAVITDSQWQFWAIIASFVLPIVVAYLAHSPLGSKLSAANVQLATSLTPQDIQNVLGKIRPLVTGDKEAKYECAVELIQSLAQKYGQANKTEGEALSLAEYLLKQWQDGTIHI